MNTFHCPFFMVLCFMLEKDLSCHWVCGLKSYVPIIDAKMTVLETAIILT